MRELWDQDHSAMNFPFNLRGLARGSQGTKKCPQILDQQFWFLQRRKMTASWHVSPALYAQAPSAHSRGGKLISFGKRATPAGTSI
jgi:hypothetical protein